MERILAPISSLVPTQYSLHFYPLEKVTTHFNVDFFHPISAVRDGETFLIGDGHHRTALFYLASRGFNKDFNVPTNVVTTDAELRELFTGSNKNYSLNSFRNIFSREPRKDHEEPIPSEISKIRIGHSPDSLQLGDVEVRHEECYAPINGVLELIFELPERNSFELAMKQYEANFEKLLIRN